MVVNEKHASIQRHLTAQKFRKVGQKGEMKTRTYRTTAHQYKKKKTSLEIRMYFRKHKIHFVLLPILFIAGILKNEFSTIGVVRYKRLKNAFLSRSLRLFSYHQFSKYYHFHRTFFFPPNDCSLMVIVRRGAIKSIEDR